MKKLRSTSAALLLALTAASPAQAQEKSQKIPWDDMDLGSFHTGCFKVRDQVTAKGIAIKVGTPGAPATVLFDPELLRVSAAWTGGFLQFPRGRGGLEGQIAAQGEVTFSTDYAPGWSTGAIKDDPRDRHQGHLPNEVAKFRGLYTNGDKVVLKYTVGTTAVLEAPGYEEQAGAKAFTRTFTVAQSAVPLTILLADLAGGKGSREGEWTVLEAGGKAVLAGTIGAPQGTSLFADAGRLVLKLPAVRETTTFKAVIWAGAKAEAPKTPDLLKPTGVLASLETLTKGGPAHWGAPLETKGKLGSGDQPYVIDEIPLPEDNPFRSWLRPGGHDFLPNGDAVLANLSGDVWLVSGLDEKLESVKWKRIATGLFQPLGCRVLGSDIYVLGRDQITRLHDLNGDGETDFYECFNNDCIATDNYHEFALDLQTDRAGNFYYAKGSPWTPTNNTPHQGTMLRVSKDGSKLDVVATGLRAPNGLGMGPDDTLTCSDNQGHWMPANRLNIIKPGGFYGMTPAAHKTLHFKAADGTEFDANPSSEEDRKTFKTEFWGNAQAPMPTAGYDLPLLWMPQNVDNSPGGEVWVSGGKWGPWEGRMLHLSYGKCLLYGVTKETVDGVTQGGVVRFPFKFPSGIMRARFHPKDGQLYASGLNVWQSDAAKFGCFTRVRYTGAPVVMTTELHALPNGIELQFSGALDEASATDAQNYSIERWNYKWTGAYGSPDLKVSDGKPGKDLVLIDKITLGADRKTLTFSLPEMSPCMQMRIKFKIQSADGKMVEQDIHNTIHRLPGAKTAAQ